MILRAAVISLRLLCALLCRLHLPDSFVKPPPWFSMWYSGRANSWGPFVLKCSLCLPLLVLATWTVLYNALLCCLQLAAAAWLFCEASSSYFRVLLQQSQSLWTVCFLMFAVHFCSWLKNCSKNEEMNKFGVVRIVLRPFGIPMDGPHAKCSLCYAFLYIVATPQFCITHWHPVPGMQVLQCTSR